MLGYNDLYEILRKEKNSEVIQPLTENFLEEFKTFLSEKTKTTASNPELFSEAITKSKKQLENAQSMFRELILKRKRKILNLVFIATETEIMKKDFENMLDIEKQIFKNLIKTLKEGDKQILNTLSNKEEMKNKNSKILFNTDVESFVDHAGTPIGPFKSGETTSLDKQIAKILVAENKAIFTKEKN